MFREIYDTDLESHVSLPEAARCLERYRALAGAGGEAPFEALMDALQEDYGRDLVVVERRDGTYHYLHCGEAVGHALGFDMTGRSMNELPDAFVELIVSISDRVLAERRPLLLVHRSIYARNVELWERLTFPCRTRAGEARLVALMKPRKMRSDVLHAVLEASCDGVMSLRAVRDASGEVVDAVILTANRRAAEYAGYTPWQLIDGRLLALFPFFTRTNAWERCRRVVDRRTMERFEIRFSFRGLDTWLRTTVVPLDDGFVISMSDISDLHYALFEMEVMAEEAERARVELSSEVSARALLEGELRRIAVTDGLTGVLNRRGFDEVVRAAATAARRDGHPLSVIAVDIDHFKRINDAYGHAGGDTVLMDVVALFAGAVGGEPNAIGRVGGEEFMFLLPETDAEGAAELAEQVRLKLAALPIKVGEGTICVTASFGVRALGEDDAERMLLGADNALYEAKRSGRNRVVLAPTPRRIAPAA